MSLRSVVAAVRAVLARPDLWVTALRQVRVLARPVWWRRAPFLPVPEAEYLKFRVVTAYGGDGTHPPEPGDVITYLEWCRAWPLVVR